MSDTTGHVKKQLKELVQNKYGQCDERLMESGVLDSLKAVELAIEVGTLFDIDTNELKLKDMATLTSLARAIVSRQQR